jgi:acetolactate synthase small subunit
MYIVSQYGSIVVRLEQLRVQKTKYFDGHEIRHYDATNPQESSICLAVYNTKDEASAQITGIYNALLRGEKVYKLD